MLPQLKDTECADIIYGIDILEESIRTLDAELLDILLFDRTTRKSILWATDDYVSLGIGFETFSEITSDLITGRYATLIQPRTAKPISVQVGRIRDKAEVFTPSLLQTCRARLTAPVFHRPAKKVIRIAQHMQSHRRV